MGSPWAIYTLPGPQVAGFMLKYLISIGVLKILFEIFECALVWGSLARAWLAEPFARPAFGLSSGACVRVICVCSRVFLVFARAVCSHVGAWLASAGAGGGEDAGPCSVCSWSTGVASQQRHGLA